MKSASSELLAYIASGEGLRRSWRITQKDGTVVGFTNWDQNVTIDGVLFQAPAGFVSTDIASNSDLSVGNSEAQGIPVLPAVLAIRN